MKKVSELSMKELIKTRSTLKSVLIAFSILALLSIVSLLLLKAETVLFIPSFLFPVLLLPALISLKSINDEIKSRNINKQEEI
jgi:hypothetical protein